MSIQTYWYRSSLHPFLLPLLPFSFVFGLVTRLRRWTYRLGLKKSRRFSIPVIVIGNITVGGTGKTPLVIWLANFLKEQGKNPGIALRGSGGKKRREPVLVTTGSDPFEAGDEAVLIAKNTNCPVAACVDRSAAVNLLKEAACDFVLCDDGLQHYRLARELEIAVIDGDRYFGNGQLLPAGPLREPIARLNEVDFIVINEPDKISANTRLPFAQDQQQFSMRFKPEAFMATHDPTQALELTTFSGKEVHAIAGLGNPQRFFDLLTSLNIKVIPHCFSDHHPYVCSELDFSDALPILMTEKDAIKCQALPFEALAKKKQWYLRVSTEVSPALGLAVNALG